MPCISLFTNSLPSLLPFHTLHSIAQHRTIRPNACVYLYRHSAHLFIKTKDINSHNSPDPRTHVMKSEVGNDMERAWCDDCGCGIWIRTSRAPELTYLKAGMSSLLSSPIFPILKELSTICMAATKLHLYMYIWRSGTMEYQGRTELN